MPCGQHAADQLIRMNLAIDDRKFRSIEDFVDIGITEKPHFGHHLKTRLRQLRLDHQSSKAHVDFGLIAAPISERNPGLETEDRTATRIHS